MRRGKYIFRKTPVYYRYLQYVYPHTDDVPADSEHLAVVAVGLGELGEGV